VTEWLEYWVKQWEYFGEIFKKQFKTYLNNTPQEIKDDIIEGFLRYSKSLNYYYIDVPALADLIIAALYRDLQYGYPECKHPKRWRIKCAQSMKNKLTYIYVTMATLDERLQKGNVDKTVSDMLRGFVNNTNINIVIEHLHKDIKDMLRQNKRLRDRLGEVKKDEIKEIVEEVMKNTKKTLKNQREPGYCSKHAPQRRDIIECLIGTIFRSALGYLEGFVAELAVLYVYIANNKMIMPFGVMQHVIHGPLTLSQDLGDFLDPESDSLIEVKRKISEEQLKHILIRLSTNLRKPVYIVIPRYCKEKETNHTCIVLDKYELKYKRPWPRGEHLDDYLLIIPTWGFMGARIPDELLKIKSKISLISEEPVIKENPETKEKFEEAKCKCIDPWATV